MKLKDYMFMSYHYRVAIARPRVHGGYAVMMNRVIITPVLDDVEVWFSRFYKEPHKRHLSY